MEKHVKKRIRKKVCKRHKQGFQEELSVWFAKFEDHRAYCVMQYNTFLSILYDLYSKQPDKGNIDTMELVREAKRITEERLR